MLQHQIMHRHSDARLIVFLRGVYVERSFTRESVFSPGDFIIRPAYFAHEGYGCGNALYVRLPLPERSMRAHFSTHGWQARWGRLSARLFAAMQDEKCRGDEILEECETVALGGNTEEGLLPSIATALWQDNSEPLKAIAARGAMRPWTLTRAFRSRYGLTPSNYRYEAMIQRALWLLAETDLPYASVAAEAGFADHSHFCRSVRRTTGKTPSGLRRALAPA